MAFIHVLSFFNPTFAIVPHSLQWMLCNYCRCYKSKFVLTMQCKQSYGLCVWKMSNWLNNVTGRCRLFYTKYCSVFQNYEYFGIRCEYSAQWLNVETDLLRWSIPNRDNISGNMHTVHAWSCDVFQSVTY